MDDCGDEVTKVSSVPDGALERMARQSAADPETHDWVERTRRAAADGTLGPGLGREELEARISELTEASQGLGS